MTITITTSDLVQLLAESLRTQAWKFIGCDGRVALEAVAADVAKNQAQLVAMSDTSSTGYWAGEGGRTP